MDRKEKRFIHLKITNLLDKYCSCCELKYAMNSHIYCREQCSIGEEFSKLTQQLSDMKFDVPVSDVKKNPKKQNLKKGRWSTEDEFYLINHVKYFSQEHLAEKLNRDVKDIYNKIYRLKMAKKIFV